MPRNKSERVLTSKEALIEWVRCAKFCFATPPAQRSEEEQGLYRDTLARRHQVADMVSAADRSRFFRSSYVRHIIEEIEKVHGTIDASQPF